MILWIRDKRFSFIPPLIACILSPWIESGFLHWACDSYSLSLISLSNSLPFKFSLVFVFLCLSHFTHSHKRTKATLLSVWWRKGSRLRLLASRNTPISLSALISCPHCGLSVCGSVFWKGNCLIELAYLISANTPKTATWPRLQSY